MRERENGRAGQMKERNDEHMKELGDEKTEE